MFCNNCGNPLQDGQRFCSKCGTEHGAPQAIICPVCGSTITSGAKFCDKCGSPIQGERKRFCQSCGTELHADDQFCPSCGCAPQGDKTRTSSSSANLNERFNELKPIKKLGDLVAPNESREIRSLSIKHVLLAGVFLLIVIFMFIPALQVNVPSVVSDLASMSGIDLRSIPLSTGNLISGNLETLISLEASASELAEMKLFCGFGTFISISILGLAIFFTVYPLFKHTVFVRRRFVYQFIASIGAIVSFGWWCIMCSLIVTALSNKTHVNFSTSLTFFGFLYILLLGCSLALCILIVRENHRITDTVTNGGQNQ